MEQQSKSVQFVDPAPANGTNKLKQSSAEDAWSPADVYVYALSPAGVYANSLEFIEEAISNKSAAMNKKFEHCKTIHESKTARLLLLTQGVRLLDQHKAQSAAWKDLLKKRLVQTTSVAIAESSHQASGEDQVAARLKDVDVKHLTEEALSKDFVPVGVRALFSLIEFISAAEEWAKPNLKKIKVAEPYSNVVKAFGLDQKVAKNLADVSDTLTLGRLLRSFQATFVVSPGDHKERFDNVLVRTDSAFMENVILVKGVGPGKRIPVAGIFVYDPHEQSAQDSPVTDIKEDSVIYVKLPLSFVIHALQETASEISAVFEESEDDVI